MGSVPCWATVSDSSIPLHSGASEHPVGHPMLTACIAGVQEPSIHPHTHTAHLLLLPPGSAPPAWVTLALCTVSSWRCSPEGTCCLSWSSTVVISWCGSAILQPSYLKEGTEAVRYQAKPGALSVCSMQPPWFISRVPMASSEPTAAGCLFSHSKEGAALSPFPAETPNHITACREAQDTRCLLGFTPVLTQSPEHPHIQQEHPLSTGQCRVPTHQTRTPEGFPNC